MAAASSSAASKLHLIRNVFFFFFFFLGFLSFHDHHHRDLLIFGHGLAHTSSSANPSRTALSDNGAIVYKDPSQPLEARIQDLLGRMTLAEKIGQMTQIDRTAASAAAIKNFSIGIMKRDCSCPTTIGCAIYISASVLHCRSALEVAS
jgi:hypothetical protein